MADHGAALGALGLLGVCVVHTALVRLGAGSNAVVDLAVSGLVWVSLAAAGVASGRGQHLRAHVRRRAGKRRRRVNAVELVVTLPLLAFFAFRSTSEALRLLESSRPPALWLSHFGVASGLLWLGFGAVLRFDRELRCRKQRDSMDGSKEGAP